MGTAAKLSDVEWREFQSIPDQGYSHRAWVDHKITERADAAYRQALEEAALKVDYEGHLWSGRQALDFFRAADRIRALGEAR